MNGFSEALAHRISIKKALCKNTTLLDILRAHNYPWQVAPQQSLLPFKVEQQKYFSTCIFTTCPKNGEVTMQ